MQRKWKSYLKIFATVSLVLVFALLTACGGSGDGSDVANTITSSGGLGGNDDGYGGTSGNVEIWFSYGGWNEELGGGDINIKTTGSVDASFTPTSEATITANYYLGTNPCSFTTNTTMIVNATTDTTDPALGTCYLIDGQTTVYKSDGDGTIGSSDTADEQVTGIMVSSGVTLTLDPNWSAGTVIYMDLDNDFVNQGTLMIGNIVATGDTANFILTPESFFGYASSTIDTRGRNDGDDGGDVMLGEQSILWNYVDNSIFNFGDITTSGADSTTGDAGNSGDVMFYAEYGKLENTGVITTDGGTASGASGLTGGDAGGIDIYTDYGHCFTSGELNAIGGDGVTSGGDGGDIYLYIGYVGDLRSDGNIYTMGGDATTGNGGDGGDMDIYTYGADIYHNADIDTSGGSTTDPAFSGGDGGYFDVYNDYEQYVYENGYMPAGDINISGDINTSGGDAVASGTGDGGEGGYVDIESNPDYAPMGQNINLLGYTTINTSGKDGNFGGHAGHVQIWQEAGEDAGDDAYNYFPGGNIYNEAEIITRGGNVATGATTLSARGGHGGQVEMESDYFDYGHFYPETMQVNNMGNIDATGGESLNWSSTGAHKGGHIWFWGYNKVENSGDIIVNGGNDRGADGGTDGYGAQSGWINMYSNYLVNNSGNITSNGGDGEYEGGFSDNLEFYATNIISTGNITANAGDADDSLAGSTGGDGIFMEMWGVDVSNTGIITVSAGTGTTDGSAPDVVVGTFCITGTCW